MFLQHGMLSSSCDWVINFANGSLGMTLLSSTFSLLTLKNSILWYFSTNMARDCYRSFNSFNARGVVTFVPGGELGQVAFSEVNMGEKKLGDIKTQNLHTKKKLLVLRVQ